MAHKQNGTVVSAIEVKKKSPEHVKENGPILEAKQPADPKLSESEIYAELERISGASHTRIHGAILSDLNNINHWLKSGSHGGLDALKVRLDAIINLVHKNRISNKEIEIASLHATARLHMMKAQEREALSFEKLKWLDSDNLPKDDAFLQLLIDYYQKDLELLEKEMPEYHPEGITFLQWQEEKNPQFEFARRYTQTLPAIQKLIKNFSGEEPLKVDTPPLTLCRRLINIGAYLSSLDGKGPTKHRTGFSDTRLFSTLTDEVLKASTDEEVLLRALGRVLYATSMQVYTSTPGCLIFTYPAYYGFQESVSLAFYCLSTTPRKMALWRAAIAPKDDNSLSSFLTDETRAVLKKRYDAEVAEAKEDMQRSERIQTKLLAVKTEKTLIEMMKNKPIPMLHSDDDYHNMFFAYITSVLTGVRAIPVLVRNMFGAVSEEEVKLKIIAQITCWLKSGDPFGKALRDNHTMIMRPILDKREKALAKREAEMNKAEARKEGARIIESSIKNNRFEQAVVQMINGDPMKVSSTRKLNAYINELFDPYKPLPENIAAEIAVEQKGGAGKGGSTGMIFLSDPNSPKTRLALTEKLLPWFSESSNVSTALLSHRALLRIQIKQNGDKRAAMMSDHEFRELSSLPMTMPENRIGATKNVGASFRMNSK